MEISQGKYVGMVLIDLQKAFDTVDHDIYTRYISKIKSSLWVDYITFTATSTLCMQYLASSALDIINMANRFTIMGHSVS